MAYYISKTLSVPFDDAVKKAIEELKKEGFGIISEIDIDQKFKEKLGVEFRRYKILGACNPPIAYEALKMEDKLGTMLPCNVIVQEVESERTEIAAVDPIASMQAVKNERLGELAGDVKRRLERVIQGLG